MREPEKPAAAARRALGTKAVPFHLLQSSATGRLSYWHAQLSYNGGLSRFDDVMLPDNAVWSNGLVRIERIVPDLSVTDLAGAIREHSAILGLHVLMDHGWIATLGNGEGPQLNLITADATAPVNPDVSVFVDDVDAAHTAAQTSGVEIVHPLTHEAWGVTRFFYRDAAGRVVNVGQHS